MAKLRELDLSHLYILQRAVNEEINRKECLFDEEIDKRTVEDTKVRRDLRHDTP